jgi:hypothetical protein
MTPEKIARAIELRGKNWTLAAIADDLGASIGAVRWQLMAAAALDPSKPNRLPAIPTEPRQVSRGGHIMRLFTQEEDARLLALEAQGLPRSQIARNLGRPHNSVRARLMTIARHQEREDSNNV